MIRKVVYAGSFDPFTRGHADIVERALRLFDVVIVAIGINEQKRGDFSPQMRQRQIAHYYRNEPRIEVLTYSGLTSSLLRELGVEYLVRGLRSSADLEHERTLADLNRHIAGIETLWLPASQSLTHISSSAVRELMHFGYDVSEFLPEGFDLNPQD